MTKGRFEGLTDTQWLMILPLLPVDPVQKGKGHPRKVERAISWLQRKFRRLAVRWERRMRYWQGFLAFGLITFWIDRLLG